MDYKNRILDLRRQLHEHNNRYYVLDKSLYNFKPNERWGEAYQKLADILY